MLSILHSGSHVLLCRSPALCAETADHLLYEGDDRLLLRGAVRVALAGESVRLDGYPNPVARTGVGVGGAGDAPGVGVTDGDTHRHLPGRRRAVDFTREGETM